MQTKRTSKYLFIIFLICFITNTGNSQNLIDIELKSLFNPKDTVKTNFKKPLKNAVNEIDIFFSTGFLLYKNFISSQDKPSCIFSPSCSEYAVEAFQKKGLFVGWVKTFDRLSRCNGFANQSHYHFINDKKLFYDPVD